MDILDKARKLESTLARTLDRAAHQWAGSARREPLEVVHAIVEAIGERLEPAGRGAHVFPFNKLTLSVLAGSRETRARFAAVFEAEPTLQERITKRLHDAGCAPADLRVHARYVSRREAQWSRPDFHIEFARIQQTEWPAPARGPACALKLTVVHGLAERLNYSLSLPRINLGRCAELRDSRNRLVRTNHVAFTDMYHRPQPQRLTATRAHRLRHGRIAVSRLRRSQCARNQRLEEWDNHHRPCGLARHTSGVRR